MPIRLPISLPATLLPLTLGLTACFGGSSGGGGDGDPSTGTPGGKSGGAAAPTLSIPGGLSSDDGEETIDITVDDPGGGTTTYTWSLVAGPADAVAFDDPASEDPTVTFPRNGDYTLEVAVTGEGGTTSETIDLSVAIGDSFTLGGSVADDGAGTDGTGVTLQWTHLGTTLAVDRTSTSGGDFSFAGLVGTADAFALEVLAQHPEALPVRRERSGL